MFQRGEGPLFVAFGFVKIDTAVHAIPVLDLLEDRDELGVAARKESEELFVTVVLKVTGKSEGKTLDKLGKVLFGWVVEYIWGYRLCYSVYET